MKNSKFKINTLLSRVFPQIVLPIFAGINLIRFDG